MENRASRGEQTRNPQNSEGKGTTKATSRFETVLHDTRMGIKVEFSVVVQVRRANESMLKKPYLIKFSRKFGEINF
jgi:hypothetical protein